jgi:hypothetical protein
MVGQPGTAEGDAIANPAHQHRTVGHEVQRGREPTEQGRRWLVLR